MNKVVALIVGFLVLVLGVWWMLSASHQGISDTGPIVIGYITPLSGDAAPLGEPVKNATALAVQEINEKGGINGRELQVIYEDGKCDGKGGATAAEKLISVDKVHIIIGGGCSGETMGAAPIAEKAHVILLSPSSGSAEITNAGDYIFRNFPSDASSGEKIADVAIQKGFKQLAVLSEQTDYAQALHDVFFKRFTHLGGTVVANESFLSNDKDMRAQIAKIKSTKPSAIYIIPQTPATLEVVLKQMQELGLKTQILSNEHVNTDSILKRLPQAVEGALYAEPAFDESRPEVMAFLEKYKNTYGSLGGIPAMYLATNYDAPYLIKDLIEKNGTDPEKIKNALYQVKDWPGVAGPLTIDKNGDAQFQYTVKIIRNGKPAVYSQ